MGRSGKGNQKKSNGKSESVKSEIVNKKSEISSSNLDEGQSQSDSSSGSQDSSNKSRNRIIPPAWISHLKTNVPTIASVSRTNSMDLPDYLKGNGLSDEYLEFVEEWLENKPDDIKEAILTMINEIRELKAQVEELKDWATKKITPATQKLAHDLLDLKISRMEKTEREMHNMMVKQLLESRTSERFLEMKLAMCEATYQVHVATRAMRRLEVKTLELRAEIEACNSRAAESDKCLREVANREKKHLKKFMASEQQRRQLEEEIEEEKKKALQLSLRVASDQ